MALVKKIPSTENGTQVRCKTKSGQQYLITQNRTTMKFTLWAVKEGGYEKLGASGNPTALYSKIPW